MNWLLETVSKADVSYVSSSSLSKERNCGLCVVHRKMAELSYCFALK